MNANRVTRQKALNYGIWAEYLAAFFLILKAYSILAIRFRSKDGEVDLIIRRGHVIAFVEVKARSNFTAAIEAIDDIKLRKFRKAADYWLMRNSWAAHFTLRGDAVVVQPWRLPVHIEDAFQLSLA